MRTLPSSVLARASRQSGMLTASELITDGLNFKQIRQLIAAGLLEKIERGLYQLPGSFRDERLELAKRIPKGVFCLHSAAAIHGLSDVVPGTHHLAVPSKSKYVIPSYPPVQLYFWGHSSYQLGTSSYPLEGGEILVYDPEKTICDMIRMRNKTGMDQVRAVLRAYLEQPGRDLAKLTGYARRLHTDTYLLPLLMMLT
ncbi:MAG: type IV toxin-antitoxin system AbiEi family antitoxin domain-containing protein [Bacteroidia bacterium]|nr:type IV toxin-antitoxin system AbiEi family antitoxin domain-containing protein [Bacteroidia bacterium]